MQPKLAGEVKQSELVGVGWCWLVGLEERTNKTNTKPTGQRKKKKKKKPQNTANACDAFVVMRFREPQIRTNGGKEKRSMW